MNLVTKRYIKKRGNVHVQRNNGILKIVNESENTVTLILPKIFICKKEFLAVKFFGNLIKGEEKPILKIVDRRRKIVSEVDFNTNNYLKRPAKYFMIALRVMPNTDVEISDLDIEYIDTYQDKIKDTFKGNILVVAPGYPSDRDRYNMGFVHTRVKEYKKLNWNIDVISANDIYSTTFYEYEGIKVCKTSYLTLRNILQEKKYDKILIHFFNDRFAQILDATDISNTRVYLYSHGADTMYRDYNIMTAQYFTQPQPLSREQEEYYKFRDKILNRYNNKENVKWFFVTEWTRKHSEELNNIKYKNSEIVPCFVDNNTFTYEPKDPELRKKIFMIRKFHNVNTYSIDIDVRVILELSRRPFFNDLEFNIYGDGCEHERLVAPIKNFPNVHIHKRLLTHQQIADAHKQNGIALFATRYDSQAVSSCEAAMSGLVVISSKNPGVEQEINPEFGTLCETENYIEYADKIEELYYDKEKFLDLSKKMHDYLMSIYSYDNTIQKELDIFKEDEKKPIVKQTYPEQDDDILLTIAIPSYNVGKYLKNGVFSLINNNKYANKLEILIINDGSKDNTAIIGKELERLTTVNGKSIVKLIDKENGGHGSTINEGIKRARGKYFKLMDGDDYFDTEELEKLLEILEHEDTDIILNNYIEDFAETCTMNVMKLYEFMTPGIKYYMDDLCIPEYGFKTWGPLLSTSTYRTEMLRNGNFKITEKCFYVDMELNLYAIINAKTVKYYPLNLYVYYLGRQGQSISRESYTKNYKHHEKITLKLLQEFTTNPNIGKVKKEYLKNNMIIPMVGLQYYVETEYLDKRKPFYEFDKKMRQYSEFYNDPIIATKRIKFHRITRGYLIKLMHIRDNIIRIIRRK